MNHRHLATPLSSNSNNPPPCSSSHHHHDAAAAGPGPVPRLLPNLKLALSVLYSLPVPQQQQQQQQPHLPSTNISTNMTTHHPQAAAAAAANDFLIHLQSRNLRRKLQSLHQGRRDQANNQKLNQRQQRNDAAEDERFPKPIDMGSSWLACLHVLCGNNQATAVATAAATEEECLFCAQTLLHRLRRAKLIEAIDWEMEQPNTDFQSYPQVLQFYLCYYDSNNNNTNQHLSNLATSYKDWMLTVNPFIGSVLLSSSHSSSSDWACAHQVVPQDQQERILKGELSLLTLAALVYSTATASTTMDITRSITTTTTTAPSTLPLLSTLASAMATLVLRLLYSPTTTLQPQDHHHHQEQQQEKPTIVATMARSLTVVHETMMMTTTNNASSSAATAATAAAAFDIALNACLAAIPDTLLGSPGGARGRLSMDPRCVRAATHELRHSLTTGLLWQTLQQPQQPQQPQQQQVSWHHNNHNKDHHHLLLWSLRTLHAWAKFLPLPAELVQQTMPLFNAYLLHKDDDDQVARSSSSSNSRRHVALSYLMAICEGGAWSLEDVLSYSLGLSEQQLSHHRPSGKKRQSSKSKKRQKELIETNTTESLLAQAHAEEFQRGDVACLAVSLAWEGLNALTRDELGRVASGEITQVDGEGPIGCLAAAANACLPHIVRSHSHTSTTTTLPPAHDLFQAIISTFQEICASPNKGVRGLSFEPLYTLHAAVLDTVRTHGPLDEGFEQVIVDFLFQCSMSLAAAVRYPLHYFDDLDASSDEEIEIERNDVRDLLRTIAGSGEGGSTSCGQATHEPVTVALKLLSKLLHSCENVVSAANQQRQLVQEAAVHLFSSLAKPLNSLAASFASHDTDNNAKEILVLALRILLQIGENVTFAFDQLSLTVNVLLPLTRTVNIATASLAPMISSLCASEMVVDAARQDLVIQVITVSVQVAAHSIVRLPELTAQSILCHSQYDIRGAMRGPGGEDHVGVLALMRLTYESDSLARLFVKALGQFIPSLCELHQQLKLIELERGQGTVHGRGVTPKSRRILLNVLCHLEFMSEGHAGASDMLIALFDSSVEAIASLRDSSSLGEKELFQMCEAAFDLGCFSSPIVRSLFIASADAGSAQRTSCLEVLTNACIQGYGSLGPSTNSQPRDKLSLQWNRLRAALFFLLRISGDTDLPERAAEMIQTLVRVECEAMHQQCLAGPSSKSSIFHDEIVSAESIPGGIFVRVVGDVVQEGRTRGHALESMQHCVKVLLVSREHVLSSILLECSDPLTGCFSDPRPTLWEAWLFSMSEIIATITGKSMDPFTVSLLTDSCVTAISLLFYPKLGRTLRERMNDPGMSFDGPQSLALTDFLTQFFALGAGMLEAVALVLAHRIPIDIASLNGRSGDPCIIGASIIGAALFRAAQGGLPPWAIESIPEVYSTLYFAVGRDPATFGLILRMAMDVRLSSTAAVLGGVQPGELLSGRFFESMCETTKEGFIRQSLDLCSNDNASSWRRLKVLIKQLCGGKKKETDFKQKPSATKWDFERI